jgi:hypothetical protein
VMLRWPLDALAAGAGFSYNYYAQSDWFTFKPVKGADHVMYFASNWPVAGSPNTRLGIWRWYEDATGLSAWDKTIPAYSNTYRGDAHCGTPNWAARYDQRVLAGARYLVSNDGIADSRQPGRKVLGWWWNVKEGGGFTSPYIEAAAFFEDNMTLLPGYIGRPYVYGLSCYAYPDAAPNLRGDLGLVFTFAQSPDWQKPNAAYGLADDYYHAPPGWPVYGIVASNAGPSDQKWGDYNTTNSYMDRTTWLGSVHYIPGSTNCSNCSSPVFFSYGRERDLYDFWYW